MLVGRAAHSPHLKGEVMSNQNEMIARLYVQGKSVEEIARRMGRDADMIKALLKQQQVQDYIRAFEENGEGSTSDTGAPDNPYTDVQKRDLLARLKAKALWQLEQILDDVSTSAKAMELKTRAALWVLERDAVMNEELKAQQGVAEGQPLMQPIYMDARSAQALNRMLDEFGDRTGSITWRNS